MHGRRDEYVPAREPVNRRIFLFSTLHRSCKFLQARAGPGCSLLEYWISYAYIWLSVYTSHYLF